MVYKINWKRLKRGPRFSGQSKAYMGGVAAAKWGFRASHKTAHKVGVAAVGGYHVAKRGGRFHPFNLIPKAEIKGNPYSKKWWLHKKSTKSKRGSGFAIKRTGRPKSRKTMRARSAPKPKMVRYRKGGCPPGYVYDPKRKMCIQINK